MNHFGDVDCSIKRLLPVYDFRSEKFVSLQRALEPVESQIDQLPYYIKTAKNIVIIQTITVYQKINELRSIFIQWIGEKRRFIVF